MSSTSEVAVLLLVTLSADWRTSDAVHHSLSAGMVVADWRFVGRLGMLEVGGHPVTGCGLLMDDSQ